MASPPDDPGAADPLEASRRLGKRYVIIAFVTFASAFVVLSTWQLISAVFAIGAETMGTSAPAPLVADECTRGLRSLADAVERALAAREPATESRRATTDFHAALAPEWDEESAVEQRCAADPHGPDAYAAVLRLRRAGESVARRQAAELAPLRRDVAAYVRP